MYKETKTRKKVNSDVDDGKAQTHVKNSIACLAWHKRHTAESKWNWNSWNSCWFADFWTIYCSCFHLPRSSSCRCTPFRRILGTGSSELTRKAPSRYHNCCRHIRVWHPRPPCRSRWPPLLHFELAFGTRCRGTLRGFSAVFPIVIQTAIFEYLAIF